MCKLEEFYRLKADSEDPDIQVKKAISVVGLQSMKDVKKVWVFNKKVHIGEDGHLIPPNESPYIWLADFSLSHFSTSMASLPTVMHLLYYLIK